MLVRQAFDSLALYRRKLPPAEALVAVAVAVAAVVARDLRLLPSCLLSQLGLRKLWTVPCLSIHWEFQWMLGGLTAFVKVGASAAAELPAEPAEGPKVVGSPLRVSIHWEFQWMLLEVDGLH